MPRGPWQALEGVAIRAARGNAGLGEDTMLGTSSHACTEYPCTEKAWPSEQHVAMLASPLAGHPTGEGAEVRAQGAGGGDEDKSGMGARGSLAWEMRRCEDRE
ncbi:hypothetical protein TREES_T100012242 [Tupaia chinensis]|uniref:Uncharacterized protein n=1 Tax=Tupaia chinensis TaxID=246437 RepID=L9JJL0_TUPCH|nr:hypothetical protein TREES_T100012242 [Tupaia chinensis]